MECIRIQLKKDKYANKVTSMDQVNVTKENGSFNVFYDETEYSDKFLCQCTFTQSWK